MGIARNLAEAKAVNQVLGFWVVYRGYPILTTSAQILNYLLLVF